MTRSDWLNVIAILLAPLIAVQVSLFLDRRKERRQRQLGLFKTLMATRASTLNPDHVQALNMIDIEFFGADKKSKKVVTAWRAYLDHLNQISPASEFWSLKRQDLFVDLLHEMATSLGYDFDKTSIRQTSYFPKGYGEAESDQLQIRKGLAAIVQGKQAVAIVAAAPPQEQNEAALAKRTS